MLKLTLVYSNIPKKLVQVNTNMTLRQNNPLKIYLLSPSGFCAGVERAVSVVHQALIKFKAPIYVKHQIVHNKNIIEELEAKGVVFTNDLDSIPEKSVLIFNAHGVTKEFEEEVKKRNINYIDATCPLVKKVHREAKKLEDKEYRLLIIGHSNHPEVVATKSRISQKAIVIEDVEDAKSFMPESNTNYGFVTQTTLSVDSINEILEYLQKKIPNLVHSKNICYATQNRQNAIKSIIDRIDGLIIIGSQNSSNSNRLKEMGENKNIPSYLVDKPSELPIKEIQRMNSIAISAGASSPYYAIQAVLEAISAQIPSEIINHIALQETVKFILPKF